MKTILIGTLAVLGYTLLITAVALVGGYFILKAKYQKELKLLDEKYNYLVRLIDESSITWTNYRLISFAIDEIAGIGEERTRVNNLRERFIKKFLACYLEEKTGEIANVPG